MHYEQRSSNRLKTPMNTRAELLYCTKPQFNIRNLECASKLLRKTLISITAITLPTEILTKKTGMSKHARSSTKLKLQQAITRNRS